MTDSVVIMSIEEAIEKSLQEDSTCHVCATSLSYDDFKSNKYPSMALNAGFSLASIVLLCPKCATAVCDMLTMLCELRERGKEKYVC